MTTRQQETSASEFVSAIETVDLATTMNVAEEVGREYRSAYYHLNRLEEDGVVESKKIGAHLLWHTE
ncbi:helix-turn-helix domain-containing protein [Halorussus pelagicus]|uniref:transcriptional regulator n=1 Tax=Halorussus pelagicus TaxID=2505977 RepID=UPI000FFBA6E0|nr:transcriptional regulator [Halorussus pelagicus]